MIGDRDAMRPEALLLDHFAALAAAPGGVAALRQTVLQLAVQGRLVPQDPADEPAGVLLERIAAEKRRLVREGKIRKAKPLPAVEEVPYAVPEGWEIVRLGEVVNYNGRQKTDPKDIPKNAWLLELEDIEKDTSRIVQRLSAGDRDPQSTKSAFKCGDVLYGKLRPYLNKVVVADGDGYCTTEIAPISIYCDILPQYLMYALKRPEFIEYVNSKSYGMKMPRLGANDAIQAILPLPPLPEQHRIVAKVDALMALCDALEARQAEQRETHTNLGTAALAALSEAAAFEDAWALVAGNFDLIFDSRENVAALRQTVLQLAVQGRLVPQDPADEPAGVLLERIAAEKRRLVREGVIGKVKPLPSVEEVPYAVPEGWVWTPFGNILLEAQPGFACGERDSNGIVQLRMNNVNTKGNFVWDKIIRVPKETVREIEKYIIENGDVLFNNTNSVELVGKSAVFEGYSEPIVYSNHFTRLRSVNTKLLPQFIALWLNHLWNSKVFENLCNKWIGQSAVNRNKLLSLPFPLPPLPEQHRIVAKVDALMALCDALDARIAEREEAGTKLIEAVVGSCAS